LDGTEIQGRIGTVIEVSRSGNWVSRPWPTWPRVVAQLKGWVAQELSLASRRKPDLFSKTPEGVTLQTRTFLSPAILNYNIFLTILKQTKIAVSKNLDEFILIIDISAGVSENKI
jgi:hypothetical protein